MQFEAAAEQCRSRVTSFKKRRGRKAALRVPRGLAGARKTVAGTHGAGGKFLTARFTRGLKEWDNKPGGLTHRSGWTD